jgi:hypothetical protein
VIDHVLSIHARTEVEIDRRIYLYSRVCEINTSGFINLVIIHLFLCKLLSGKNMTRTLLNEDIEYDSGKLLICSIFIILHTMMYNREYVKLEDARL